MLPWQMPQYTIALPSEKPINAGKMGMLSVLQGMVWREAMEFVQVLPERAPTAFSNPSVLFKIPAHQITSAIMR